MKKRIFALTGGILLLAAVAGLTWMLIAFRTTAAPITASDTFLEAFLANDTEKAYALTNDTFKDSTDRTSFNQVAGTASKLLDKKSLKISTGNVEENENGSKRATIYYDVVGEDAPYRLTIVVFKPADSNEWQVMSVSNAPKDAS